MNHKNAQHFEQTIIFLLVFVAKNHSEFTNWTPSSWICVTNMIQILEMKVPNVVVLMQFHIALCDKINKTLQITINNWSNINRYIRDFHIFIYTPQRQDFWRRKTSQIKVLDDNHVLEYWFHFIHLALNENDDGYNKNSKNVLWS